MVTDQTVRDFNTLRINNQSKEYSRAEIIDLLSTISGMKKNSLMITIMIKYHVILNSGRGIYTFTKNPIYSSLLAKCFEDYSSISRGYSKKSYYKRKEDKSKENEIHTEDFCIKFLKERGYKIYKEVTRFEEI